MFARYIRKIEIIIRLWFELTRSAHYTSSSRAVPFSARSLLFRRTIKPGNQAIILVPRWLRSRRNLGWLSPQLRPSRKSQSRLREKKEKSPDRYHKLRCNLSARGIFLDAVIRVINYPPREQRVNEKNDSDRSFNRELIPALRGL